MEHTQASNNPIVEACTLRIIRPEGHASYQISRGLTVTHFLTCLQAFCPGRKHNATQAWARFLGTRVWTGLPRILISALMRAQERAAGLVPCSPVGAAQDPMNPAVLRDKILDVMLDIGDVEFVMKSLWPAGFCQALGSPVGLEPKAT